MKDPNALVTIKLKEGEDIQVKIGITSSDGKYAFCQMVGDNTVYACNSTYSGYANFTKQTIRLETISTSIKTDQDLKYMFMQKKGSRHGYARITTEPVTPRARMEITFKADVKSSDAILDVKTNLKKVYYKTKKRKQKI